MEFDSPLELAVPEVVAEEFSQEIVVLNLSSGKYFGLEGAAADLWRDLAAGFSPTRLIALAPDADTNFIEGVKAFVAAVIAENLLRPRSGAPDGDLPQGDPVSAAALRAGGQAPALTGFDDMADLILADPIHDVEEEIGWPVLKRNPTAPT
jgi:hypothetical protein